MPPLYIMKGGDIMTGQQIEKFIDAGYTKAEIELLFKDPKVDPIPEEKETETVNNEPKDIENAPETNPTPTENFELAIKSLSDSIAELKETVRAIQSNNINNAHTDSINDDSVDNAIKSFLEKF